MADAAFRTAPVPAEPAVFQGVTIALGAPLTRWSLRARDPAVLAALVRRELPARVGATTGDIACLGPDEWLLRAPVGTTVADGAGQAVAIVDVSERAVCLELDGPRALEVLQAGCPRDLRRFAVGEARRTVFEGVEIVLLRTAQDHWEVDVWRSFAAHLHLALITIAAHLR